MSHPESVINYVLRLFLDKNLCEAESLFLDSQNLTENLIYFLTYLEHVDF